MGRVREMDWYDHLRREKTEIQLNIRNEMYEDMAAAEPGTVFRFESGVNCRGPVRVMQQAILNALRRRGVANSTKASGNVLEVTILGRRG